MKKYNTHISAAGNMPQDSLRSVVYRSFVTCDGSKGVAECKTIRKSKKIKNASTSRHGGERKEKPSPQELQNLSCFQMMEVSRGADRLNEVIHSLSNRPSCDRPSNHIATDLLRGALHLQESLLMLGKLQEASNYISKNQKEKKDFQKPRMSADLAPRDCYDELREAIRESFARQNLLPKERIHDHDKASISSESSSSIQSEKMHKGSNLIAKLMGLEEVPSIKQTERGRFLDIDLPRPNKKPEFMGQKVVRQRLSLEEIIETMQFKGILRRKSVDVDGSNAIKFHGNESFAVDGPPIVIMRPLHRDGDQISEEEHIKSRQILIPKKTRRESKQPSENSKLKQKINKGKVGNSSGRVGVKPAAKRSLDSQDKLSIAKTNNLKPPVPKMRKKAAVKVAPDTTKPPETKDAKPQMSDKTQDLNKLTTVKHSRNMRENNVSKSQIASRKDKSMKPASLNPTAPKKNQQKTEANRKPSSSLVESILIGGDFAINNIEELVKNVEPDLSTKEVAKASPMAVAENYRDEATSPNVDLNRIEDGILIPSLDQDHLKGCKTKTNKRQLLLSNASFLNYIEELFDIKTHASIVFQTASLVEGEVLHDPLLLDCAKEILQRKSTMMRNHWSQHLFRKAKCHLSTEQLVEEICDAIEGLHNYSKPCGEGVLADSIYPMLERDIRWNEEVTGGWDLGWRKGYTTEAVDKVMHDVEELVLSEIVGDVIIEIIK